MAGATAIGIGGALLGGLAGAGGQRSSQTTQRQIGREGELEREARGISRAQLSQLEDLVQAGPGIREAERGLIAQEDLAARLQQLQQTGLRPEQVDIEAAQAQLAPQRTRIAQAFEQEQQRAARLATQLNRPINDPIIQARLSQERQRAEERLGAQEAAGARQANLQRLGFSEGLARLRSGLASQALANRQTLLGLGEKVRQAQQNFRLGAAPVTQTGQSGGGFGGFLTGAIGGAGSGLGIGAGIERLGLLQDFRASQPFSQGFSGFTGTTPGTNPGAFGINFGARV